MILRDVSSSPEISTSMQCQRWDVGYSRCMGRYQSPTQLLIIDKGIMIGYSSKFYMIWLHPLSSGSSLVIFNAVKTEPNWSKWLLNTPDSMFRDLCRAQVS